MYAPEKEALVWKIKNFPGGKEFLLRCKFGLPSVAAEEEQQGRMPPIRVNFEIPYFTVSGIQARTGFPMLPITQEMVDLTAVRTNILSSCAGQISQGH